jgi:RNAse (barnase) inhibitor barstar
MAKNNKEEQIDNKIMLLGAISKYYDISILEEDLAQLTIKNYEIYDLDLGQWTFETFHSNIQESLNFPEYYGKNLSAFRDCLGDMFEISKKGIVIVMRRFNMLYNQNKDLCEGILDGIDDISWEWLILGKKLICLIQSDDPDLFIDKIGGYHPVWNNSEWLDSKRRSKSQRL